MTAEPEHQPASCAGKTNSKPLDAQTKRDSDNITSVTLHVRPRPNLPTQCLEAFLSSAIDLRSIAILWEHDRPGWQRVVIQISPSCRQRVTDIARRLSEGDLSHAAMTSVSVSP